MNNITVMKNVTNAVEFIYGTRGVILNLQTDTLKTTNLITTLINTANVDTSTITTVTLSSTEIVTGDINADSGTIITLTTPILTSETINSIDLVLSGTLDAVTFTADTVNITNIYADTITATTNIVAGNHIQSHDVDLVAGLWVGGASAINHGVFENIAVTQTMTAPFYKSPGQAKFAYSDGTFTPRIACLQGGMFATSLVKQDFESVTDAFGEGYFIKIGSVVDIWYNTRCTIPGPANAYGLTVNLKYPIVTDLPFKCGKAIAGSIITAATENQSEFPNGYFQAVPAPLEGSFAYPFAASIYEAGYQFKPILAPYSDEGLPWVADGYTIIFSASTVWFFPLLGYFSSNATVFNFHVLQKPTYPIRFDGHLRYFTDD